MQNLKGRMLAIAGVLGVITAILVYVVLARQTAEVTNAQVTIVTARAAIAAGVTIDGSMIEVKTVSKNDAPLDVAQTPDMVLGKLPQRDIRAGDPIMLANLTVKDHLSQVVPQFMRAVTVAVDSVIGVSGLIKPGDRVDVVATFNTGGGSVTRTVLQNAEVLAVGTDINIPEREGAKQEQQAQPQATATLSVSPTEVEKLVLADSKGKLRLALRSPTDTARVRTKGVTGRALIGRVPNDEPSEEERSSGRQAAPVGGRAGLPPMPITAVRPLPIQPLPLTRGDGSQQQAQPGKSIQVIRGSEVEEITVPN